MSQHPHSESLGRVLERCQGYLAAWSGTVFRSTSPRYANRDDLLTGEGSRRAGGRWNPPNSFRTMYASLDPATAMSEALAHYAHYRLPLSSAMPRVFVSIKVRLQRALALTRGVARRVLQVSLRDLTEEPWREMQQRGEEALTQAIGRLAYEKEWEGLLVPSAAEKGGTNLIVFPANLRLRSGLEIMNRGELPPTRG